MGAYTSAEMQSAYSPVFDDWAGIFAIIKYYSNETKRMNTKQSKNKHVPSIYSSNFIFH